MSNEPPADVLAHPIQPLEIDERGTLRFKKNAIVRHLLDHGGIDMNGIAVMDFSREDREQFAQLIGYSHDGAGTLSYFSDKVWYAAQEEYESRGSERSLAAGKVAPVAWILTRTSDPTFPRVYMSEGEADRMMATNNLPPFCKKHPVYTAPPAKASEPDLHPKTADLVNRFARALAEKLAAAEAKYGYSDGWASPDWMDECRAELITHVYKGDPRDVGAYCAFLWHHGSHTNPRSPFCEKCGSAEACDCTTTAKASGSAPDFYVSESHLSLLKEGVGFVDAILWQQPQAGYVGVYATPPASASEVTQEGKSHG